MVLAQALCKHWYLSLVFLSQSVWGLGDRLCSALSSQARNDTVCDPCLHPLLSLRNSQDSAWSILAEVCQVDSGNPAKAGWFLSTNRVISTMVLTQQSLTKNSCPCPVTKSCRHLDRTHLKRPKGPDKPGNLKLWSPVEATGSQHPVLMSTCLAFVLILPFSKTYPPREAQKLGQEKQ